MTQTTAAFDVAAVRADFPILSRQINGKDLVYLDSAATAQKPSAVIEAIDHYYRHYNANVHRGLHTLSEEATAAFENARETMGRFLNTEHVSEVIFTRGTTESINLVAQSYGRSSFGPGDEILVSNLEHHSNIVPWQILCQQTGAELKVIPVNDHGEIDLEAYANLLSAKTRLVAVNHISNAIGTVNPVKKMAQMAHDTGAVILLDGAQAAPHTAIDVQDLDCDFYALSGHKMFGPTGIGVLYGKAALLEAMPPWMGGGDMIKTVSFSGSTWAEAPSKFEAGTPNIAGAIGIGAAANYLLDLGLDRIAAYEHQLLEYGNEALAQVPGLTIIGDGPNKASVFSFVLQGTHPHDVGSLLSNMGLAVRTGHHCAQPIMDRFDINATTRASLAFYNTTAEIDALVAGLHKVRKLFGL